jgi:hypothetical protein
MLLRVAAQIMKTFNVHVPLNLFFYSNPGSRYYRAKAAHALILCSDTHALHLPELLFFSIHR